jgi:hypothetical protein
MVGNRLAILVAVLGMAFASPSVAHATQFKGAVDYWGAISFSVNGNAVTAIKGLGGGLTCASGTSVDPVVIKLASPVPVVQGRFQAEGVGETEWGTPNSWSLIASISIRRVISGTVTTTAQTPTGEICKRTYAMSAVVAPRAARSPTTSMYSTQRQSAARVRFDYRRAVVTHLVVQAPVTCPNGTSFSADLDSVTYDLDPIQVNRGRFRIAADVLDGYGVVMHISMTGTINGHHAAGAVSANRGQDINGHIQNCAMHGTWNSDMAATAPPPATASSGAFYNVTPYRYGKPGVWTYYLEVEVSSCGGGVVAVKFTIAGGASKTVACGKKALVGPVSPKRTYRMTAAAIRSGGASTPLAESNTYVPGDDGNWIRVH